MAVEDEIVKEPELLDPYESENSIEDQKTLAQFSQARQLQSPQHYTQKKSSGRKPKMFRVRKRYSVPPASLCSLGHLQVVADQTESMRSHCKRKRARATINQLYASDDAYLRVMERAKVVQLNLDPAMPSLAKLMLRSHVTHGFWLGLAVRFCKLNLPKEDCIITLVGDGEKEYETRYLAEKTGLSGGWRGFSIAHNLAEGDAVVFQLIKATKFKVYIIRAKNLDEVDGALGLLNLDTSSMQIVVADEGYGKHSRSYPVLLQENNQNASPSESVSNNGSPAGEWFENDSEEFGSHVLDGIRMSAEPVEFKDVKIFENFTIIVNDLILDSQLPEHVRVKYYELCCSQKAFLHDQLLEGINCKLITGIISEIVNVADAMRACKLTTSQNDLKSWDKILKAFEQLGMNVGFLRARLHRLISLAFESKGAMDSKLYNKAMFKRACLDQEMKNLDVKCMELKEARARNDKEIETLKLKAERHEMKFQSEVRAPW
ncbi:B3 domain-containing protein Os01g0234100-like isoform X2 [Macadamia integrifolia]|uniref:B3 domain-containing protein Os01g0234100-like isoform X2 n=1 Tax=Macadamia integrifolia TaxID=60698 RepID=UPI001C4FCC06|nr:B3 domain-containing protein Os01g0234100-like isoform X2 [Macadamia integrifolia]